MLELKIIDAENGWISAELQKDYKCFEVANSSLFGNDVIRNLLHLIVVFAEERSKEETILWNSENEYYLCKYVLDQTNVIVSIYYYDNICTERVIQTKQPERNNGIKIFEEMTPFWWWGKNIYNEICGFLGKSQYKEKTGFKIPIDLKRKAGNFYRDRD